MIACEESKTGEEAREYTTECPFWERNVTLGQVYKGQVRFAKGKTDKRSMLTFAASTEGKNAVFFIAWTGKWSTDIFSLKWEDLASLIMGG